MGRIITLEQNMVNMIAAGEVIERPANVVKELMENSLDAGATRITVSVEDGGRKLISVEDNGCGMDAEDLVRAFEPHATSKIKTDEDLRAISTLGFRGEALTSIASVAQVTARSRTKETVSGNRLEIDCGNKSNIIPCSADYGTAIHIRDIFYKLPARRKFLKTANTEMSHISEHFSRIALANNNLDLTLTHNGRELRRLTANDGLRQRIAELFSPEISEGLIKTESNERRLNLFALLGRPENSRTSNKFQYVFLNGRHIRDKFVSHAIKESYRGSLEPNRFPVAFLFIKMPYEEVDVNVHPTKIEVRFYNANLVHSQILSCLREKLLGSNLQTKAKLAHATGPAGFNRGGKIADAMSEFMRKHRPAQSHQQFAFSKAPSRQRHETGLEAPTQYAVPVTQRGKNFIQIHDSFIVAQSEDGFIIVDQHALHERVLYHRLHHRILTGRLESQRLLIPESFELDNAQADAVKANAKLIEKLGIEIVPFGPRTYAVQAFPSLLSKASPGDFARDLIDLLTDKAAVADAEALLDEVLNMAACKAAVKAGQKLSDSEIEQLLEDKEKVECANHCPHGRPTAIKFSLKDLEKQFMRT